MDRLQACKHLLCLQAALAGQELPLAGLMRQGSAASQIVIEERACLLAQVIRRS